MSAASAFYRATPGGVLLARWASPEECLEVLDPDAGDLDKVSGDLADFYNDPYNSARLTNTIRFTAADVGAVWREIAEGGGRCVLLVRDGALVGDAVFRPAAGGAELGVLVGPRTLQGHGLGSRFTLMLLKLAFGAFGHARVYVAIRPDNTPSLRLFARMGFTNDDGDEARSCTEAADEVSMSLDREAFARLHADALGAIREAAP